MFSYVCGRDSVREATKFDERWGFRFAAHGEDGKQLGLCWLG